MSEFRKTTATVTTLRTTLHDLHETASTLPPLPPPPQPLPPAPSVALSRQLNEVSESAGALSDKMDTYRSRLTAVDPVTGQARYGDKMKKSVSALLEDYAALTAELESAFEEDGLMSVLVARESSEASLRLAYSAAAEERRQEEERLAEIKAEEERIASLTEQQRREEKEAQEREELRLKAEEARRVKAEREEREREERERLEREERERDAAWLASIERTTGGLTKQISLLPPSARAKLLEIYTEVHKRPENELARKVKLENAKFHEEIGQHEGGKEALVAAGWSLQKLDGEKFLVLVEPNLETDLDGWSTWFDRIKEVREILENYHC